VVIRSLAPGKRRREAEDEAPLATAEGGARG
jgi:hypothetical protein